MRIRSIALIVLVVAVLFGALQVRELLGTLGAQLPRFPFPYGKALVDNLAALLVVAATAWLLSGPPRRRTPVRLGLGATRWQGPLLSLVATLPWGNTLRIISAGLAIGLVYASSRRSTKTFAAQARNA